MKHDSGTASAGVGAPRRKSLIALIASFSMLLLGLVGVVAAPGAAAHTPGASLKCDQGLKVTLSAYQTKQSNATPNNVKVTIDGVEVANVNFGTSYSNTFGGLDPFVSHTASVVVDAWDGNNGTQYDWSWSDDLGPCDSHKVKICHATASESNPYTTNEISWNGADNAANINWNGHGDHNGDIIPPFANFPGRNWDAAGQAAYNNGCKPPTVYTGHASASVDKWICYNGNDIHLTYNTGDVTDTSSVSQADANAKAQTKANAQRDAWLAGQLANYLGYKEGKCTVYNGSGTKTVDQWICTGTGEDQESVQLYKKFDETATSTISQADADQKAQKKADDAAAAWLADQLAKYPGAKEGKCNTYTGHGSASVDKWICANGTSVHLTYSTGDVTDSSKISQAVADQKAQAKADAQAAAWLADQLKQYPGYVNGKCTATAQRSGEITICADVNVQARASETIVVNWQTAVYQAEGATTAEAQAAADALADAAVPAAKAAALAPYPNYTEGSCKDATTYGASRGASGSATICTADGKTVQVNWSGSAAVSGQSSQDVANTQAQNNAQKAADADKAAKLAAFPGATQGACVPPTTTSPVVVTPQPGTVPVKKPVKKPVAAPKPASVPAGYAGTVPAAVPAGGGSSAPQSDFPTWAMLLIVAGAAGAAFSIKRLASQR